MGGATSELTHDKELEMKEEVNCTTCNAKTSGADNKSSHFFPDDMSKKIRVVYTKVTGGGDRLENEDGTESVFTKEGDHLVRMLQKAHKANQCVKCFHKDDKNSFDMIKSMCLKKGYFVTGEEKIYVPK